MERIPKTILIIITVLNTFALLWFLLGSTANFQRGIDLVTTVKFIVMWVPLLVLVLIALKIIIKSSSHNTGYTMISLMIISFFIISIPLFISVNTVGWLSDHVRGDPIKITSDGKFEYRLELLNVYQNNHRERLYVRNVSEGEEMYISLEIFSEPISAIYFRPDKNDWTWSLMTPTDESGFYELSTTEYVPGPKQNFLIDIKEGTSRKLE